MHYPFVPIQLGYCYSALEPQLCSNIVLYHYEKHYTTYVNKLNSLLSKYPSLHHLSLEELIVYAEKMHSPIKTELLNYAGGTYNHKLYFKCLDSSHFSLPQGELSYAIKRDFGSFMNFKALLIKLANSINGSGYIWLIDNNNRLEMLLTPNQDTPLAYSVTPLLTLDLWEHSYYIQYINNREKYIENLLMIINWNYVESRYEQICNNLNSYHSNY